ncbi:hypothetical protein P3J6_100266 [Pseudoalteromonas sp. 3J6]|nr:hypothetical protein P3J6_100266 [Pseudoalteromonas sp. 3J6]
MLEINEAIITAAHGPATYNDSTVATSNSLIATQYIGSPARNSRSAR